jgi:hypothetical protein
MSGGNKKKPKAAGTLVGSVADASKPTPDPAVQNCPGKKHFVKVALTYKDDRKAVVAAACKILKGTAEVDAGPLVNGVLATAKTLQGGSYEVTFPEIDADEWEMG